MGDRCISMPTMFSVPGGTPVGGDCQGLSLGWLSGDSFSIERVTLGARGAERPRIREGPPKAAQRYLSGKLPIPTRPRQRAKNREAGRRPARQKGGEAAYKPASQRLSIPTRPREPLRRG